MNKDLPIEITIKVIGYWLLLFSFLLSCSMTKDSRNDLKAKDIKHETLKFEGMNVTVNVDSLHPEETPHIFFADSTCVISSYRTDFPSSIMASVDFNPQKVGPHCNIKLSAIKTLLLRRPFSNENRSKFYKLPLWIQEGTSIEYVRLEDIHLDDLRLLKNGKIRYLIFDYVELADKHLILDELSQLKHLKYLAYDFLSAEEIKEIKKKITWFNCHEGF